MDAFQSSQSDVYKKVAVCAVCFYPITPFIAKITDKILDY